MQPNRDTRIIFSHGLDSGPQSRKNSFLRPVVEALGWQTEAVDDRDFQNDPPARVRRLVERIGNCPAPPILVGSSLGGFVSVMAAEQVPVLGLWLMAPALYMEDRYKQADPPIQARTCYQPNTEAICVVHGWNDDIIPWQHSVRFAEQHAAALHLLAAGHRFGDVMPELGVLLCDFVNRL